ncbi:MAG: tRNA epoxyqueuosine(34) reductase QueG [Bacteroidetes bacterium]|nr:tRNA epoxyqueuosine(34) reductase QueG [Bacteroidota bacterium]
MSSISKLTSFIRDSAKELGFAECGIAPASFLSADAPRLDQWLQLGQNAEMAYMENHHDKRLDPRLLVDGAKSVIVFLYNYFPGEWLKEDSSYLISSYAYGNDYHDVIRGKLTCIIENLRIRVPGISIRGFVDSAPVLERAWATRAGLGWIGKNSMLISRKKGSFFFLAELITNLELEYDQPFGGDYCGDCSRCMDACPTQAIVSPRTVDAGRCISYLTIENKREIPADFKGKYEQWIFGCDICQKVCPWNKYSTPNDEPGFSPSGDLKKMESQDWESLDQDSFNHLFRRSPIKRAKFAGLRRNIEFLK